MAAVLMFRDGDTGELTIQASDQPDWMAESLWVAVAAIQRGQAVIVMDDEVDAVGDELALQAPAQEPAMEKSPKAKPLTAAQVRMMFDALDRAAEMRGRS